MGAITCSLGAVQSEASRQMPVENATNLCSSTSHANPQHARSSMHAPCPVGQAQCVNMSLIV